MRAQSALLSLHSCHYGAHFRQHTRRAERWMLNITEYPPAIFSNQLPCCRWEAALHWWHADIGMTWHRAIRLGEEWTFLFVSSDMIQIPQCQVWLRQSPWSLVVFHCWGCWAPVYRLFRDLASAPLRLLLSLSFSLSLSHSLSRKGLALMLRFPGTERQKQHLCTDMGCKRERGFAQHPPAPPPNWLRQLWAGKHDQLWAPPSVREVISSSPRTDAPCSSK